LSVRVRIMSWAEAEPIAGPIRFAIFMQTRHPEGVEVDTRDNEYVHAVAFDEQNKAIGTGRLLPDGTISRMAVVTEWRRRGVGSAMLDALVEEARKRGYAAVKVVAPMQAMEFYRSRGYVPDGKIEKAGDTLQQPLRKPLAD
jgi:GNAT superfamily N-acetyltransferase